MRILSSVEFPLDFVEKDDYVSLDLKSSRIRNSHIQMEEDMNSQNNGCFGCFNFSRPVEPRVVKVLDLDAIIFHVHGGGFVSMQSGSHQTYLRTWANKTEIPIFSVDYWLAPEYPYPLPLNDVF
jgi:acetyl esterase/lipase